MSRKSIKSGDYERLEFLGDAVLELVSSEFLFHEHPEMPEGELTKMRAVNGMRAFACLSAQGILSWGSIMLLGKGEEATGGREQRESIISDVMEAVIGRNLSGRRYLRTGKGISCSRFILSDLEDKTLFL